jgi:hypothetical protein
MLYTIQDTTLTAMGDAIRGYKYGDIVYNVAETLNLKNAYLANGKNYKRYSLPTISKKTKIKINSITTIDGWPYSDTEHDYLIGRIGVAVGKTQYDESIYDTDIDFYIPKDTVFPYEVVVEDTKIAFVNTGGSSTHNILIDLELTILDENGEEYKYTPLEMVDEVYGIIEDFANAPVIPEKSLTITGNCDYRFSNNGWNWFIENNGDKLTTKDINALKYMFYYSNSLEEIPFNINTTKSSTNYESVFYYCNKLKSLPYIIGPERTPPTSAYNGTLSLSNMFSYCSNIRTIPYDFFWKMIPNKDFWDKNATLTTQNHTYIFNGCYSLRELPDISMLGGAWTSAYSCLYYYIFNSCYSLDKIENLPVCGKFTSNAFMNSFDNCYRLKELTFAVNEDGTPKTANWKSQTINTKMFGYMVNSNEKSWLNYNHGITADKKVSDDASYQLLKDNPDYYTTNERYSLYNHDSAVRTINSLPDCSATGTNTIHLGKNYGLYTDEGPISNLTEEEIAVAVAKGWTVSLS